jgi:hypothetical protein
MASDGEEHKQHGLSVKYSNNIVDKMRENPWIVATCVLAVLLVVLLVYSGIASGAVSEKTASANLLSFIKAQGKGEATFVSAAKEGSLYQITVNYQEQDIPVDVTADGKYLVASKIPLVQEQTQPAAPEENPVPKSDKPVVELFVMSFCPYGLRAENNILPVVRLLNNSIDFKIRYIVQVAGTTINDVQSLHGINEAKEDARQLIIMRDYPAKFYDYIAQFNANCYQYGQDAAKLDVCWKNLSKSLGMDSAKIESAAYGSAGIELLKAQEALDSKYGVSGSPTLVINGVQSQSIYAGTEATQTAICGAFNTAPAVCGTKAAAPSGSSAPAGSCG